MNPKYTCVEFLWNAGAPFFSSYFFLMRLSLWYFWTWKFNSTGVTEALSTILYYCCSLPALSTCYENHFIIISSHIWEIFHCQVTCKFWWGLPLRYVRKCVLCPAPPPSPRNIHYHKGYQPAGRGGVRSGSGSVKLCENCLLSNLS
jgi:hypothetical protein